MDVNEEDASGGKANLSSPSAKACGVNMDTVSSVPSNAVENVRAVLDILEAKEFLEKGCNAGVSWNEYHEVGTSFTPISLMEGETQTSQSILDLKGKSDFLDAETCMTQLELNEASTWMSQKSAKDAETYLTPPILEGGLRDAEISVVDKWTCFSQGLENIGKNSCDVETWMSQEFLEGAWLLMKPGIKGCIKGSSDIGTEDSVLNQTESDESGEAGGETENESIANKDFIDTSVDMESKSTPGFNATPEDFFGPANKENEFLPSDNQDNQFDQHVPVYKRSPESASPTTLRNNGNKRNPLRVGLSKNFKPSKPLHHRRFNQ